MVEVQGNPIKKFVIKQFLPLGFIIAVAWALIWAQPGHDLYAWKSPGGWKIMSTINICIIFFIFGLTLETSELKEALKNWKVWSMGVFTILVLTSFTAFIFVNMGFEPVEFGIGLAVFACSPTSLSSAISLVIQSYGNGAMSLLLTVVTNLLGIITTPLFVSLVLGPAGKIDKVALLVKLLVQILVPLVVGKGLREAIPVVKAFCQKYKLPLYLFNNFQIIMIVWQTLSYSRDKLMHQKLYDIILAIMGAVGQHFFFLVMNFIIAWVLRFPDAERKAYVLSSSQKSLPTAAVVIEAINNPDLNQGLITIPCMVFYIMQLFIDSFIASSWSGKYERADMLRAKYADQLAELYKLDDPESALFLTAQPQQLAPGTNGVAASIDAAVEQEADQQGLLSGLARS